MPDLNRIRAGCNCWKPLSHFRHVTFKNPSVFLTFEITFSNVFTFSLTFFTNILNLRMYQRFDQLFHKHDECITDLAYFYLQRFQKASDGSESVVAGSDSLQIQFRVRFSFRFRFSRCSCLCPVARFGSDLGVCTAWVYSLRVYRPRASRFGSDGDSPTIDV